MSYYDFQKWVSFAYIPHSCNFHSFSSPKNKNIMGDIYKITLKNKWQNPSK